MLRVWEWIKSWFCGSGPSKKELIELLAQEMKYNDNLQVCLIAVMVNKNIYEFDIKGSELGEGIFEKFVVKYEAIAGEMGEEPKVRVYLATNEEGESENELQ